MPVKPSAQPTLVRTQHLPLHETTGQNWFQLDPGCAKGSGASNRRLRAGSVVSAAQRGGWIPWADQDGGLSGEYAEKFRDAAGRRMLRLHLTIEPCEQDWRDQNGRPGWSGPPDYGKGPVLMAGQASLLACCGWCPSRGSRPIWSPQQGSRR
jgi:hypothetical protein